MSQKGVGMFKCCHTGFEHAHNCQSKLINTFRYTDLGHVRFKKAHSTDFGAHKFSKRHTVLATVCPKGTLISFSRWIPAYTFMCDTDVSKL